MSRSWFCSPPITFSSVGALWAIGGTVVTAATYSADEEKFVPDLDAEIDLGELLARNDMPNDWAAVEPIGWLTEKQYLQVAELMGENVEAELLLRMKAWWSHNDPFREAMENTHAEHGTWPVFKRRVRRLKCGLDLLVLSHRSRSAKESIEHVSALLDAGIDGMILKGEVARELGRFGLASDCLDQASAINAGIESVEPDEGSLSDAELREAMPNLNKRMREEYFKRGEDGFKREEEYYQSLPIRRAAESRINNRCRIDRVAGLVAERDTLVRRLEFPSDDAKLKLVEEEMQVIAAR